MEPYETKKSKIIARLLKEGWVFAGGSKHDKYTHSNNTKRVILPRQVKVSIGVAKITAETAGWDKK